MSANATRSRFASNRPQSTSTRSGNGKRSERRNTRRPGLSDGSRRAYANPAAAQNTSTLSATMAGSNPAGTSNTNRVNEPEAGSMLTVLTPRPSRVVNPFTLDHAASNRSFSTRSRSRAVSQQVGSVGHPSPAYKVTRPASSHRQYATSAPIIA